MAIGGVVAYFTRDYWQKHKLSLDINKIDWDKKIVPTTLTLQGKKFELSENETKYNKGNSTSMTYKSNGGKKITVSTASEELNSLPTWRLTIYKDDISGLPSSSYVTLASVLVDFENRKIYDMIKSEKQNSMVEI